MEEIKPLKLSELFDVSWRVFEKNLRPILLVAAAPLVPFYIIYIGMMGWFRQIVQNTYWYLEVPSWVPFTLLLVIALYGLVIYLSAAALVKMVGEIYLGNRVGFQESYRFVFPKFVPILWASSLAGLFIFLGYLLIIPGIVLQMMFFVLVPVVVLEAIEGMEALKRSRSLMQGEKLKAFLFLLVLAAVTWGVYFVFGFIPSPSIQAIFGALFQLLILVYANIASVIFYFQARNAKETFSPEVLSKLMA